MTIYHEGITSDAWERPMIVRQVICHRRWLSCFMISLGEDNLAGATGQLFYSHLTRLLLFSSVSCHISLPLPSTGHV